MKRMTGSPLGLAAFHGAHRTNRERAVQARRMCEDRIRIDCWSRPVAGELNPCPANIGWIGFCRFDARQSDCCDFHAVVGASSEIVAHHRLHRCFEPQGLIRLFYFARDQGRR
ncbi:hypothetical protein [Mesorhizobium sp. CN2-181]|uniref:hypothetical protein n=1 Tax=Mesorhizobium yinganensis TaxID=3157707 RepID=UPI0032B7F031